jgi:hypothetical protein
VLRLACDKFNSVAGETANGKLAKPPEPNAKSSDTGKTEK